MMGLSELVGNGVGAANVKVRQVVYTPVVTKPPVVVGTLSSVVVLGMELMISEVLATSEGVTLGIADEAADES